LGHATLGIGRLITQRVGLTGLGEIQHDQQRETDDRGESCVGTHRVDEVADRKGKWDGFHRRAAV
jgi:hypothetical protein